MLLSTTWSKEKILVSPVGLEQVKGTFPRCIREIVANVVATLTPDTVRAGRARENTHANSYGFDETNRSLWCLSNRKFNKQMPVTKNIPYSGLNIRIMTTFITSPSWPHI